MPIILIVEDEPELVRVLRAYLEKAGYEVLTAFRGDSGLSLWEHKRPDLVILDLNLPGIDGLEVAREIRRKAQTPILMLTARVEDADQILGIEIGADDYITKPFSPQVLVAHVQALLRRSGFEGKTKEVLHIADIEIDLQAHRITRAGEELRLTPMEFDILVAFVTQPARAFTRLQLLEAAQGQVYVGYERNIDVHIKNLRAKIEPDPKNPRYIETVFGVGYRLNRP